MSKRQPSDINKLAFSLVNDLTSDEPPAEETPKNPVAVARGKKKHPKKPLNQPSANSRTLLIK